MSNNGINVVVAGLQNQNTPFSKELRAVERPADDACSLRRWVGPGRPDNLLHLGQDAAQILVVLGNHSQVSNSLIWQQRTERRTDDQWMKDGRRL